MHHKNNVPPVTLGEAVTTVTVTPDAPHNFLDDLKKKFVVDGVDHEIVVHSSQKHMKQYPTKRQLDRAKALQRRTH